jgi:UDP-2,3-diacylglucosamine pyrophosphatase LpxH
MPATAELTGYNLLVVSDLHLSEGRDPKDKKFSRNEDFFFDEEFARFLAYYQTDPRRDGRPWHLIINGDFADLLQVVTREDAPPDLHRERQSRFGLACGEEESVYKIGRIAQGHWLFFEALAGFLAAGNLLTLIRGNHDVEFHFRKVQQAFVAALLAAGQEGLRSKRLTGVAPEALSAISTSVRFSDWFYFEPKQVWIEHGNRYDELNSFECWLSPLLPVIPGWPPDRRDEIDLPFGSLFVRYLFNSIEQVEPFADNVKPASKFISWMLRRHPVTALRFIFGDGSFLLDRVRRAWRSLEGDPYAARRAEHRRRLDELIAASGIPSWDLEELDAKAAPSLLRHPSGRRLRALRWLVLHELEVPVLRLALLVLAAIGALGSAQLLLPGLPRPLQCLMQAIFLDWGPALGAGSLLVAVVGLAALGSWWRRREEERPKPSFLKDYAACIAGLLDVRFVVMGHTHDPELYGLGSDAQGKPRYEYFNTGTWTKVFSEEERLIREDVEFVFLEGVRRPEGLRMRLREWNDAAGCPSLLKLFRDE